MDAPPLPPSPKLPWPVWKILFFALGLPLLAVVLWLFISPDEPPPDVGDLVVAPLQLPDDQNACAIILQAVALVKPDFAKSGGDQLDVMARGKNWDAARARQLLDGTDAIWPLWDQAARTPQGAAPLVMPNLSSIFSLSKLAQIRAWDLAHRGQIDAAMASLFTTLQVGQRLEQSRGNLFSYYTGNGVRVGALITLRGLTTEFKPSAALLRQTLHQVEASRPDKAAFAYALRGEFRSFSHELDNLEEFLGSEGADGKTRFFIKIGTHVPFFFHPNQTRRISAEATRDWIGAIDLPVGYPGDLRNIVNLRKILGTPHYGNFLGFVLLVTTIPNGENLLDTRLREQSTISANEAFLALVLYHREHGELPATLDALVPDYLPAVPRDYFDGQPIRYSRDFRSVWSVGNHHFTVTSADLDPTEATQSDIIHLPLDFAAPATATKPAPATPSAP